MENEEIKQADQIMSEVIDGFIKLIKNITPKYINLPYKIRMASVPIALIDLLITYAEVADFPKKDIIEALEKRFDRHEQ